MIDAYLAALPEGREPRILASRTVFVADDRDEAQGLPKSDSSGIARAGEDGPRRGAPRSAT